MRSDRDTPMALNGIFCSSCGLEILSDQPYRFDKGSDFYHDKPYLCWPYKDMGVY